MNTDRERDNQKVRKDEGGSMTTPPSEESMPLNPSGRSYKAFTVLVARKEGL
jgi:hypothetical protein